jgi:hypothetical protein
LLRNDSVDGSAQMKELVNEFGFLREGGLRDFAGISIWNTDLGGIGFDDVIFDVPAMM